MLMSQQYRKNVSVLYKEKNHPSAAGGKRGVILKRVVY